MFQQSTISVMQYFLSLSLKMIPSTFLKYLFPSFLNLHPSFSINCLNFLKILALRLDSLSFGSKSSNCKPYWRCLALLCIFLSMPIRILHMKVRLVCKELRFCSLFFVYRWMKHLWSSKLLELDDDLSKTSEVHQKIV